MDHQPEPLHQLRPLHQVLLHLETAVHEVVVGHEYEEELVGMDKDLRSPVSLYLRVDGTVRKTVESGSTDPEWNRN